MQADWIRDLWCSYACRVVLHLGEQNFRLKIHIKTRLKTIKAVDLNDSQQQSCSFLHQQLPCSAHNVSGLRYCFKKVVPHTGEVVPSLITVQVRILEPDVDGFLYSSLKPLRFYSQQLGILQIYHVSRVIKVNVAGDLRKGSHWISYVENLSLKDLSVSPT